MELGLDAGKGEVVVGRAAPEKDLSGFTGVGFPVVATPMGADYTMVHAIARQESEFDIDRVSHAGARGLMQLMPATANEQAGKSGVAYMSASLTTDPQYNIRLGDAYFARQMDYYDGSYPLARPLYLVTNRNPAAAPSDLQREFLSFVLGPLGQEVVKREGYYPLPPKILAEESAKLSRNPAVEQVASR